MRVSVLKASCSYVPNSHIFNELVPHYLIGTQSSAGAHGAALSEPVDDVHNMRQGHDEPRALVPQASLHQM
jgi:hypothetical protein